MPKDVSNIIPLYAKYPLNMTQNFITEATFQEPLTSA